MALLEKYPIVTLNESEQEKVGEFVANFIMSSEEQQRFLVKEAFQSLTNYEDIDRLMGALSFAGKHGSFEDKQGATKIASMLGDISQEIKKEASMSLGAKVGLGIGVAGLAAQVAPIVGYAINKVRQNSKIAESMKQILRDHPELRDNPDLPRLFQAIVDFAPDVAASPLVAGNVLKHMNQIGIAAVTPRVIGELLDIQNRQDRRPSISEAVGALNLYNAHRSLQPSLQNLGGNSGHGVHQEWGGHTGGAQ
jgi:hypothetical protein